LLDIEESQGSTRVKKLRTRYGPLSEVAIMTANVDMGFAVTCSSVGKVGQATEDFLEQGVPTSRCNRVKRHVSL
jgi:hypothetical protein